MNKKFLLKLSINLIYAVVLFFCFEYVCYLQNAKFTWCKPKFGYTNENILPDGMRLREVPHLENHNKKPILFLGCSYTYGWHLKPEETMPYTVEKLTNRYCYNYGVVGCGLETALYFLEQKKLKNELLKNKPEYIIYTFMFDHLRRIDQSVCFNTYIKYGLLPDEKYNFLNNFWTCKFIKGAEIKKYFNEINLETKTDFFFKLLETTKKEYEKLFPESKFVVLIYSDVNQDLCPQFFGENNENEEVINELFNIMYSDKFKQKFKDLNITAVYTEDLIGRKMYKPEDRLVSDPNRPHPSAAAWGKIVPKLIEFCNL